jgi:hypothetical protein
MVESVLSLWPVIGAVIGAWISVFLFRSLTPNLQLSITSRSHTTNPDLVILEVEILNKSRVRVVKEMIKLRVERHEPIQPDKMATGACVGNEWIDMKNAEEICTATLAINPGERIHVERLYILHSEETLHCGLQFVRRYIFGRGILRKTLFHKKLPWGKRLSMRWTATFYLDSKPSQG